MPPSGQSRSARLIAHYLPQFHPIPENSRWWGEGFTEWDNVRRAQPLFAGHLQPRVPGELGYYDLRSPETRAAQAELASSYGIEAFCYWHYWFAGRQLLERPFNEVLASREPRLPFCLGWANHTWTAQWVGRPWDILIEQTYPGPDDVKRHFEYVSSAFADDRYLTVEGKPLFFIFRPKRIPDLVAFTDTWRELAHRAGFKGIYFVGTMSAHDDPRTMGLDGGVDHGALGTLPRWMDVRDRVERGLKGRSLWSLHQAIARFQRPDNALAAPNDLLASACKLPFVRGYGEATSLAYRQGMTPDGHYPCAMPNWDNTPRVGRWGVVFSDATPAQWRDNLRAAIRSVAHREPEHRLVFVKSWNEWAEGNFLEPDAHYGRAFLEATRDAVAE